jgi:hypothetical protein
LANVLGTQTGVALWLIIAAFGLGAAVQAMGVWFDLLRWAGAAYLVWLGIKLLRSDGNFAMAESTLRPDRSFFLQGFIVILSNPKMVVLFGALIPPFLSRDGDPMRDTLRLGLTFAVIAPYTPATSTQPRKNLCTWISPLNNPHINPAARKPLYNPWLAASEADAFEYSGVILKVLRPKG